MQVVSRQRGYGSLKESADNNDCIPNVRDVEDRYGCTIGPSTFRRDEVEDEVRSGDSSGRGWSGDDGVGVMNRPLKIAVVGDAMRDRYWKGTTDHVSPEAPIPVVKITDIRSFDGGAGNVAENLRALGVTVVPIYGSSWPEKHRLMIGDAQIARWDLEDECLPVKLCNISSASLGDVDAVIVADYCKGSITKEVIKSIKNLGKPTFIDTKGDPTPWLGFAAAVFPNNKEHNQYRHAYDAFPFVVLKQGKYGLSLRSADSYTSTPTLARYVHSVVGAGDTVVAAFVYKYLLTKNPRIALWFAAAAAAVVCEKSYTATASIEEIEEVQKRVDTEKYFGFNS